MRAKPTSQLAPRGGRCSPVGRRPGTQPPHPRSPTHSPPTPQPPPRLSTLWSGRGGRGGDPAGDRQLVGIGAERGRAPGQGAPGSWGQLAPAAALSPGGEVICPLLQTFTTGFTSERQNFWGGVFCSMAHGGLGFSMIIAPPDRPPARVHADGRSPQEFLKEKKNQPKLQVVNCYFSTFK